jgi:hypothetical protein
MQKLAGKNKTYRNYIRFKIIIIISLALLTVIAALVAIIVGSAGLTVKEVILTLFGKGPKSITPLFSGFGCRE